MERNVSVVRNAISMIGNVISETLCVGRWDVTPSKVTVKVSFP